MIVARISMSFERGVEQNAPEDVGLPVTPGETPAGGKIRGLGTHFVSPEAEEKARRLGLEEGRVNREFSRLFLRSPIPGLFVLPDKYAGQRALENIKPDPEVQARCVVYVLEAAERNTEEVEAWIATIKNQFKSMPRLGKGKEAKAEGLETIERLAQCPALSEDTRNQILSLVGQARLEQIERTDFRRRIAELDIQLDVGAQGPVSISPRRAPVADTTDFEERLLAGETPLRDDQVLTPRSIEIS